MFPLDKIEAKKVNPETKRTFKQIIQCFIEENIFYLTLKKIPDQDM